MLFRAPSPPFRSLALLVALAWTLLAGPHKADAQFLQQAVGGVSIDPRGVVSSHPPQVQRELAELIRQRLGNVPESLAAPADMRKISLRSLDAALRDSLATAAPVPDAIRFLGGLTRVEYILVDPQAQDIYLAGPAEPWRVTDTGDVVGTMSGRPVILLDDLILAFRTTTAAREVGISCSIEPTAQGRRALDEYLNAQRRARRPFNQAVLQGVEKAMGAQEIKLTGVPRDTHFACVMVAADYQMKRFGMNLEQAPIDELPGYLDLLKARRARLTNMTPRWWMACDYEPLARSEDGLSWRLQGPGVRVATEDHLVGPSGQIQQTGQSSPVAQEWADLMTANYEKLSVAAPVFGQLRNVMDLAVIAALIEKEQLLQTAGCELTILNNSASDPLLNRWNAPQTVDTQSSFIKRGREFIITASGGIQIGSWQVADRTQVLTNLPTAQQHARSSGTSWYWD